MHIVQTPGIRSLETSFASVCLLAQIRIAMPPSIVIDRPVDIPKTERRYRSSATRIFPLGFGRQTDFSPTLCRQLTAELHCIFPIHARGGKARAAPRVFAPLPRARTHNGFPLRLRNFRYAHIERLTYRNHMRDLIRLACNIRLGRSHDESAGWYENCSEDNYIGNAYLQFLAHAKGFSRFFLPSHSLFGIEGIPLKIGTLLASCKEATRESHKHGHRVEHPAFQYPLPKPNNLLQPMVAGAGFQYTSEVISLSKLANARFFATTSDPL